MQWWCSCFGLLLLFSKLVSVFGEGGLWLALHRRTTFAPSPALEVGHTSGDGNHLLGVCMHTDGNSACTHRQEEKAGVGDSAVEPGGGGVREGKGWPWSQTLWKPQASLWAHPVYWFGSPCSHCPGARAGGGGGDRRAAAKAAQAPAEVGEGRARLWYFSITSRRLWEK